MDTRLIEPEVERPQRRECSACAEGPVGPHGHPALFTAIRSVSRAKRYRALVRVECPACGTPWVRRKTGKHAYSWHTFA